MAKFKSGDVIKRISNKENGKNTLVIIRTDTIFIGKEPFYVYWYKNKGENQKYCLSVVSIDSFYELLKQRENNHLLTKIFK